MNILKESSKIRSAPMTGRIFLFIILVLISFTCVSALQEPQHDKIHISKIQTLTFRKGKYTAARRSSAIEQLRCFKGNCSPSVQPNVVNCVNLGFDGKTYQWKCEAELPNHLKFGELHVNCEGYSKPGDDNVLVGSCALDYELVDTHSESSHQQGSNYKQRQQQGNNHRRGRKDYNSYTTGHTNVNGDSNHYQIYILVFILVALLFVYLVLRKPNTPSTSPHNTHYHNNASPPTSSAPSAPSMPSNLQSGLYPNTYPSNPDSDYVDTSFNSRTFTSYPQTRPLSSNNTTTTTNSSGPGFWTGLATGAALGGATGYSFGSSTANRRRSGGGGGGSYFDDDLQSSTYTYGSSSSPSSYSPTYGGSYETTSNPNTSSRDDDTRTKTGYADTVSR